MFQILKRKEREPAFAIISLGVTWLFDNDFFLIFKIDFKLYYIKKKAKKIIHQEQADPDSTTQFCVLVGFTDVL